MLWQNHFYSREVYKMKMVKTMGEILSALDFGF